MRGHKKEAETKGFSNAGSGLDTVGVRGSIPRGPTISKLRKTPRSRTSKASRGIDLSFWWVDPNAIRSDVLTGLASKRSRKGVDSTPRKRRSGAR